MPNYFVVQLTAGLIIGCGLAMLAWPGWFAKIFAELVSCGSRAKRVASAQLKSRPIFWRAAGLVITPVGIFFMTIVLSLP